METLPQHSTSPHHSSTALMDTCLIDDGEISENCLRFHSVKPKISDQYFIRLYPAGIHRLSSGCSTRHRTTATEHTVFLSHLLSTLFIDRSRRGGPQLISNQQMTITCVLRVCSFLFGGFMEDVQKFTKHRYAPSSRPSKESQCLTISENTLTYIKHESKVIHSQLNLPVHLSEK